MAKIILKTKAQRVNELLRFTLPSIDYTKGYQPKPRPGLVGGSAAMNSVEAYKINAVRRLLERTIIH
jgi:hypothetical protein